MKPEKWHKVVSTGSFSHLLQGHPNDLEKTPDHTPSESEFPGSPTKSQLWCNASLVCAKLSNSAWWVGELLVGGFNQPIWRNMMVKLDHLPRVRGENNKSVSCHHLAKIRRINVGLADSGNIARRVWFQAPPSSTWEPPETYKRDPNHSHTNHGIGSMRMGVPLFRVLGISIGLKKKKEPYFCLNQVEANLGLNVQTCMLNMHI